MKSPLYEIVSGDEHCVLIRDVGHDQGHLTITNGAEEVVKHMAPLLKGRRLEYIDSDGERSRLLVESGEFAGFADVAHCASCSERIRGAIIEQGPRKLCAGCAERCA